MFLFCLSARYDKGNGKPLIGDVGSGFFLVA
jgi:hypothetical protein